MTDTTKYLIVFLAVLSVALVFVIGYIAMRMCTKRRMKPMRLNRRASQPNQDEQYAGADTKDMFSDKKQRRRKVNEADDVQSQNTNGRLNVQNMAVPHDGMTTESNGADTARNFNPAASR